MSNDKSIQSNINYMYNNTAVNKHSVDDSINDYCKPETTKELDRNFIIGVSTGNKIKVHLPLNNITFSERKILLTCNNKNSINNNRIKRVVKINEKNNKITQYNVDKTK